MTAAEHQREAERYVEHADRIRNADHWEGDRDGPALASLAAAQTHATLAVADRLAEIADQIRKGITTRGVIVTREDRP